MTGTGPRPPPPPVEVLPDTEATREQRQQIGEKALVSLCSVLQRAGISSPAKPAQGPASAAGHHAAGRA